MCTTLGLEWPCGKCLECRGAYVRQMTTRGLHELQTAGPSSFLTLTYDDEHLPLDMCVSVREMQLFLKRLRRAGFDVRYLLCGEYGETTHRPHYHAILYGQAFRRGSVEVEPSRSGLPQWTHNAIEDAWQGRGRHRLGMATHDSIQYTAGYIYKKLTYGERLMAVPFHVPGMPFPVYRTEPFVLASKNPGLGLEYFARNAENILARGNVVSNGREVPIPRYYLRQVMPKGLKTSDFLGPQLAALYPDYERISQQTYDRNLHMSNMEMDRAVSESSDSRKRGRAAYQAACAAATPRNGE